MSYYTLNIDGCTFGNYQTEQEAHDAAKTTWSDVVEKANWVFIMVATDRIKPQIEYNTTKYYSVTIKNHKQHILAHVTITDIQDNLSPKFYDIVKDRLIEQLWGV